MAPGQLSARSGLCLAYAALAVLGVLQAADWVDLLGSERAGVAVTVIGIIGAVLRFMTDTPAMKASRA